MVHAQIMKPFLVVVSRCARTSQPREKCFDTRGDFC